MPLQGVLTFQKRPTPGYTPIPSTTTLSMSLHVNPFTIVSSVTSKPIPSGSSRRRVTKGWQKGWNRSNTFVSTRRQCPQSSIPCSSQPISTVSFPLFSSWAKPTSFHCPDDPIDFSSKSKMGHHASGGFPANPFLKSDLSHPQICSPLVTFNEPSEHVRGMFSLVFPGYWNSWYLNIAVHAHVPSDITLQN